MLIYFDLLYCPPAGDNGTVFGISLDAMWYLLVVDIELFAFFMLKRCRF